MLTTKIGLKIPLSNLAGGQSGVLQGVTKLNYFEGVLRKNFYKNPSVQASFFVLLICVYLSVVLW